MTQKIAVLMMCILCGGIGFMLGQKETKTSPVTSVADAQLARARQTTNLASKCASWRRTWMESYQAYPGITQESVHKNGTDLLRNAEDLKLWLEEVGSTHPLYNPASAFRYTLSNKAASLMDWRASSGGNDVKYLREIYDDLALEAEDLFQMAKIQ